MLRFGYRSGIASLRRRFNCTRLFGTAKVVQALEDAPVAPHVNDLVNQLINLNLVETSQVISLLKSKLNIPDTFGAPMMMASQPSNSAAPAANAEEAAAPEKTEFTISLEKFDAASKAKTIREIKLLMPQMSLVEAKNFVEAAPKIIKEKVNKAEAEKIKAALEAVGATVTLQ